MNGVFKKDLYRYYGNAGEPFYKDFSVLRK